MSEQNSPFSITFPFDVATGNVLFTVLGIIAASIAFFLILKSRPTGGDKTQNDPQTWQETAMEVFVIFLVPVWFCLMGLVLWSLIKIASVSITELDPEIIRWHILALVGLLTALGGLIGIPFVFLRHQTNERQTKTAEQGLLTDRISKAVEQLGAEKTVHRHRGADVGRPQYADKPPNTSDSQFQVPLFAAHDYRRDTPETDYKNPIFETVTLPNLEVRIGGLYALEKIAKQNLDEHIQIMGILCAYVRENASSSIRVTATGGPRNDIQIAIDILGRRSPKQRQLEQSSNFRLDLSRSNLSHLNFFGGHFAGAEFHLSNFKASLLRNTDLRGASLQGCNLANVQFTDADLTGANLNSAKFTELKNAGKNGLKKAKSIRGLSVAGAMLTCLSDLGTPDQTNWVFGTSDTTFVAQGVIDERKLSALNRRLARARKEQNAEEIDKVQQEIDATGYASWCLARADSSTVSYKRRLLYEQLGLTQWPYE